MNAASMSHFYPTITPGHRQPSYAGMTSERDAFSHYASPHHLAGYTNPNWNSSNSSLPTDVYQRFVKIILISNEFIFEKLLEHTKQIKETR